MAFMVAAIPYVMAASAAVGAISAIQQGNAAKAAATFNSTIASQNATISQQQSAAQADQVRRENYLRLGSVAAAQGHAGGDAGQGSVLDVLGDVAAQGELERQNVAYQGELAARGYANTAGLDTASGQNSQTGSYFKAGSELLSGAASSYSAYNKLNRT